MAMLHARKAKQDVRLPAFVLESDNLDSYRPWLKRLREWTRKQGGRIMEAHLIGETIPEEDLADAEAADADADVVGHRSGFVFSSDCGTWVHYRNIHDGRSD